ncbi:hypothetical protein PAAG_12428 [Paracoccidioides lutzii Pb01]|uniref:Uncharacterized protein n=1 Tax=Paracoccidioides lutzii (strain ATCC MYA-826 / Pb01) TaxID=502779 RepID=A0A0A2V3Z7_PARBA|nr:hypothetical protein PAAG_12428 [Paracoccidioides lutzii Pb01]KGQ00885.1 hypothetical protein PAAG_12428 [Paracoccidioides lutzii Pb01]
MPHHTLVSLATEYQDSQAHKEPLAVQAAKEFRGHTESFFGTLPRLIPWKRRLLGTREKWEDLKPQWVSVNAAAAKLWREEGQLTWRGQLRFF